MHVHQRQTLGTTLPDRRQQRLFARLTAPFTTLIALALVVVPLLAVFMAPPAPVQAATIVVQTTDDTSVTQCTLRDALDAAENDDTGPNGTCVKGSGADTIDLTGLSGTMTLETALPNLSSTITVNGPGADQLTIRRSDTAPDFRIFTIVGTGTEVTIDGLTISNGTSGIFNSSTSVRAFTTLVARSP
jgi:hypothetical protein